MCAEMFENARAFAGMALPEGLSSAEKQRAIFQRIHEIPFPGDAE
jgi:hypothetical protein